MDCRFVFALSRMVPAERGYLYWDELRRRPVRAGHSLRETWPAGKLARRTAYRPVPLLDRDGLSFPYFIPESLQDLLHEIDFGAGGTIGMPQPIVNPQTRDRYIVSSLIHEAITTSQLVTKETSENGISAGRLRRGHEDIRKGRQEMVETKLRGVLPPMITPFTPEGEIYEKGLVEVVEFLVNRGVHGLFAIGSYGSFALMTTEERKRLARMIMKTVDGRVPVIFQVGSPSTRTAVELARDAADTGAAAVAAVVPFYYSGFAYKHGEIVEHYQALCDAVDVPVWIYNNPKTTGFSLTTALLKKLAGIGVAGMKDSAGNYMDFLEWINEVRPEHPGFQFMAGTVGMLQPTYYQGAPGCVAGTANAFPELVIDLYDALESGDLKKASALQAKVIAVRMYQQTSGFRPAACYPLLRWRGVDPGTVRKPWRELDDEELARMRTGMEKLGVLDPVGGG